MSVSDFRHITIKTDAGRAERVFRAAVSAFCSLPRPSRREISQLEDLTLPLFDLVSSESRRFVAAALSECPNPPMALVKRLCDERVDVAAPLLIRSPVLSDIDLIVLIGRHGLQHARAIARRRGLNPTIASLVAALERGAAQSTPQPAEAGRDEPAASNDQEPAIDRVQSTRDALRAMMLPASVTDGRKPPQAPTVFEPIRDAALTGNPAILQAALAKALGIEFAAASGMVRSSGYAWLLAALRALDLPEEQAFLIVVAAFPAEITDAQSVRLFLIRYRLLQPDVALERVHLWKKAQTQPAVEPRLRRTP